MISPAIPRFLVVLPIILLCSSCGPPTPSADDVTELKAQRRAPRLQEPANLLPYIQETHAEMQENYQQAVALLNEWRGIPELEQRYNVLQKYVDSLATNVMHIQTYEELATERTLTQEEATAYRSLKMEWRSKAAIMAQMMRR